MRGYPQFSFWISITLVKIYISCIIINQGKNTFELVGTVLKLIQHRSTFFSRIEGRGGEGRGEEQPVSTSLFNKMGREVVANVEVVCPVFYTI